MLFKNMYVCACIIHGVCLDSHSLAHCACVTGCVFVSVYFFAISCQILCVGLCVCIHTQTHLGHVCACVLDIFDIWCTIFVSLCVCVCAYV